MKAKGFLYNAYHVTCLLWLEQCTAYSKVSYKPCFPLLSKDSCTPMITAVLFIVTKRLKQCPVAEVSTACRRSRKKAAGSGARGGQAPASGHGATELTHGAGPPLGLHAPSSLSLTLLDGFLFSFCKAMN